MTDPLPEHYMVSEFGEAIELRPGGCPHCGADFITATAPSCWRCAVPLAPYVPAASSSDRGSSSEE